MGTTLKFLSENTVRKCTFGNPDPGFAEAKALGTLRKALKALEGEA